MKKIITFIVILFATIGSIALSQTYTTISSGTWAEATTWNQIDYPNSVSYDAVLDNNDSIDVKQDITIGLLTFKNNSILYIAPGFTLTVDSMSILNNAILYVEGSLIVTGGVAMANNSSLDVDLSGGIDIGGDFSGGSNVDITIDGTMDVGGDLDLGTGSVVDGSGDVYVEGVVDIPAGSDPGVVINPPLPIELLSFDAVNKDKEEIEVTWQTSSETNNNQFELYYSIDGINWELISIIDGAGNSNSIRKYHFIHHIFNHKIKYYFLRQVDYDGQHKDYNIVNVYPENSNIVSIEVYNLTGIKIGEVKSYDELEKIEEKLVIIIVRSKYGIITRKIIRKK